MAGVYFFPVKYLYDFGKKMKSSLELEEQESFAESIKSLKSHYKFIGMFTVIIMSMYLMVFLFAVLGSLF